jgi:hypothetical protein
VYSSKGVGQVLPFDATGLNNSQIARQAGVSRVTIRNWLAGRTPNFDRAKATCPVCAGQPLELPQAPYTNLLGVYLGDAWLTAFARGVYRLRIACANAYPGLIRQCEQAITQALPLEVNKIARIGCHEVYSFSKHWICRFPQHGPGPNHKRKIELTTWQQELIDRDPRHPLRGLLHSDGSRMNIGSRAPPTPGITSAGRRPTSRESSAGPVMR